MKSAIFKIKPDKVNVWCDWCDKLQTVYKEEAIATFGYENVRRETFLLFKIGEDFYTVGIGEAKIIDQPILSGDPSVQINIEHKNMKRECLEPVSSGQTLYDLNI